MRTQPLHVLIVIGSLILLGLVVYASVVYNADEGRVIAPISNESVSGDYPPPVNS